MRHWLAVSIKRYLSPLAICAAMLAPLLASADGDLPTKFSNQGGVSNTRHNLTQRVSGMNAQMMDAYRNNYGEVCVYCHTPHGANTTQQAPLWNRTKPNSTYTTYDQLATTSLTGAVGQPGPNSLTCLSCHDGTISVDSIINMPGAGGYAKSQETGTNATFLNTWRNPAGTNASTHMKLTGCLACHSGTSEVGAGATDFSVFLIGTDLKNDHPIGVEFGKAADMKMYTASNSRMGFWDANSSGKADSGELRVYNGGSGGFKVECASCHDPHGVPTNGWGSTNIRSFLRKDNDGSELCFTCHTK